MSSVSTIDESKGTILLMEWDAHSLKVLELPWVLEEWAGRTDTPFGRERVFQRTLTRERALVQLRLQETDDAVRLLQREAPPPMRVGEVRPFIQKASKGGILASEELLKLTALLRTARQYKEWLLNNPERYPHLAKYAHNLHPLQPLERQITTCIAPSGEVLDTASERLAQIRHDQRRLQKRITEQLHAMTTSPAWREVLQEPTYTLRNGRYCLPVRSEYRGRVKGIVHDTSASGATLFIEPLELVELGNRLRELESAEQEEIEAILYALSRLVESYAQELQNTVDALAELDCILAGARLALDWDCTCPTLNTDGYWLLRGARHPMIPKDKVVPIDLEIGREWTGILITGPNTGGKTVTLKTLGLLTLMTLLGLHVPAKEGTQIAIPYGVFADIGDEQSLQQSLSTFSGHIRHIARFLQSAGRHSLVLLDEIGAGTDPTEGSALARAILITLLEREARVVATTHYGDLKALAYEYPRLQNAAMEFNRETLQPTYRLLMGVPGASHAIEIAQRLGLPDSVIRRALSAMGVQELNLSEVIRQLEMARQRAEQAEQEWRTRLSQVEQLQKQLELERRAIEEERRTLRQRNQQELEKVITELHTQAEAIFRQLRQASKESKQTQLLREQFLQAIETARTTQAPPEPPETPPTEPPTEWQVGMEVRIPRLNQRGVLAGLPEDGRAPVYIGKLRMEFPISELEPLAPPRKPTAKLTKRPRPSQPVPLELMIRMMRVEEALPALEKYLDDALLAGYESIRIVHGKGTGTLRKVVHEYLSQHPQVKAFRLASAHEGGEGVTIVWLK